MSKIFGGNKEATRQAERQRQIQAVANDRQLAELKTEEERTGATRRNPRGRRLFTSNPEDKSTIA